MSDGADVDDAAAAPPPFRPEVVAAVRERLRGLESVDDPSFTGPPIPGLPLQPLERGELLLDFELEGTFNGARSMFVEAIVKACDEDGIACVLAGDAATRAFAALPDDALEVASERLVLVAGEPSPALRQEIRRILAPTLGDAAHPPKTYPGDRACSPGAISLARAAGKVWLERALKWALKAHGGEALRQAEIAVLPQLSTAALHAFGKAGTWYSPAFESVSTDPASILAEEPAYLDFAREAFELAARRLDELHGGRLVYEADRIFSVDEGQVLARAARVAARHDAPWFRTLVGQVLPRVCVAPTAARTLPSQSVAIALGYAVQTDPTPEGVQALRDALAVIRHAGVEKKLARNLKPAERGLASRPEVALRTLVGAKADKKRQAFVAACLEATWWTDGDWPLSQWRAELADTPNGAPFAFGQLWTVTIDGALARTLRAETTKKPGLRFLDLDDRVVDLPDDARLALWHPLQSAPPERLAWQRVLADKRLRSPVRQAFRELYEPHPEERDGVETPEFAGHRLRLRALVGLARREGWTVDAFHDGMSRRFGDVLAVFHLGAHLYPGVAGDAPSGGLGFEGWREGGWTPLTLGEVAPVVFSEACRAVDLLVSVSAFAIDDVHRFGLLTVANYGVRLVADGVVANSPAREHPGLTRRKRLWALGERPLGAMTQMRRRALELALAPQIEAGRVTVEARHVRVGDATVHVATGRVVENGVAVELEPPQAKATLAAVPWLPYDEVLLQRIVDNVAALLARP